MIREINIILSKLLPSEYRGYYKAWKGLLTPEEIDKIVEDVYNKTLKKLENENYKKELVEFLEEEICYKKYNLYPDVLSKNKYEKFINEFKSELNYTEENGYDNEKLARLYADNYTNFKYYIENKNAFKEQIDISKLYEKLFNGKFRIVLPFKVDESAIIRSYNQEFFNNEIKPLLKMLLTFYFTNYNTSNKIEDWNYNLEDFVLGYISNNKDNKKKISLGKIISEVLKNKKNIEEINNNKDNINKLNKLYNQRPAKKDDLLIVISRHPYDIAGMSTDRGWRSCMNIDLGIYKQFVLTDIIKGALIAYTVNKNDPNINKPLNRILIKPYYNKKNRKIDLNNPNFILNVSKIYGTELPGFQETVQKWLDEKWNNKFDKGNYKLNSRYYYRDDVDPLEIKKK